MRTLIRSTSIALLALAACAGQGRQSVGGNEEYHLGVAEEPEWEEFSNRTPHARRLDIPFTAEPNETEHTLFLRQRNVKYRWDVTLNSTLIGRLYNQEDPILFTAVIPPNTLKEGENVLSVIPKGRAPDDIVIDSITIDPRPVDEAIGESTLVVEVYETLRRNSLPCRITIVDPRGTLVPIIPTPNQPVAVRPGVVYTGNGRARVMLPAGRYTVYATRGFEYSLAKRVITLRKGENRYLKLTLRREVRTPNLVACDTHIHTKELSGHGDSSLDERMYTLAGEGIELPIATEHNQHADYSRAAERTGMLKHFTPVIGNEVTTRKGHFNIFPVRGGSQIPDSKLTEWPALMKSIRSTPDVQAIILNHPCDVHGGFTPFGPENFNPVTGKDARGIKYTFNAMELVNSGALRSDLMETYRDWFALLNRGYRITGIGSSDSHDVNRSIVGYGRTYIECPDGDPGNLDISRAAQNLVAGRAYVSMGLLTLLKVNGQHRPGDLVQNLDETLDVEISVYGPSWIQVDLIELYANGVKIREERLPISGGGGEKVRKRWRIQTPQRDMHLVAIASGPGIEEPYWPTPRPYQASSIKWIPRVLGSTNPIWIDADADGRFTAARGYAMRLVEIYGPNPARLIPALTVYDETVAAQVAEYCHAAGRDLSADAFTLPLLRAPKPVQAGFAAYIKTLTPK